MDNDFKVGDYVEWNSEAGSSGNYKEKNYLRNRIQRVHCSRLEGRTAIFDYEQQNEHLAMHKGSALKKISKK